MIRITSRTASLAVAAVALLGLTAACGGDDKASTAGQATVPGAPEIDQTGLAFKPDKLSVKSGDKVYFKNSESALHTVTINTKNASGNMKKGDVFVWEAPAAGTYTINCDFHPQMNAKVTVN
ncbi:MAG: cupredoxin domain-containing protein [Anaerolineaceae bacterium]